MASRTTGRRTVERRAGRALAPRTGWALAPRAGRAVAASFALALIGLPAALLASQAPAAAAAGKRLTQGQVSVAITGMTPQIAGPGTTIKVTGTVTNTTRQAIRNLSVQLLASRTPVSSSAVIQPGSTAQDEPASTLLPVGIWKSTGTLQAGSNDTWSVQVKAKSIGMTRFGVYPLTAEAQTALAQSPPAAASTYLPYVPAKKGQYRSSIPAATKISWVMPLIDRPLLGQPWQNLCKGAQAEALATSLGIHGRLGQLEAAGGNPVGTAEVYSAAAGLGRTAQNRAVSSEATQSLSSYDGVTWAVDPALLANVKALAGCGSSQPRWASAAHNWLVRLRQATSAEPVFVTPYADPDLAALQNNRQQQDVQQSFKLGQDIGERILHRNLGSGTSVRAYGAESQAAHVAWPADGIAGYPTEEFLASPQVGIRTLLLSSGALHHEPSTVVRVPDGGGGHMSVLLANASLTNLLAAGRSSVAGAFATAQDFLAQTALAAQQHPGTPIIVAPPRRWDPAPKLATDLLADTASAPWLTPVSLTSLAAGTHPTVQETDLVRSPSRITVAELAKLTRLDHKESQLETLAAKPDDNLYIAVATVESSAYQGKSTHAARHMLAFIKDEITRQEHGVQIFAESRVTLGGLKGSVPVSIDNRLGYAVNVRLHLTYSQVPGASITITPVPRGVRGVLTVPSHQALTVKLHVQATQVGSTIINMSLQNKNSTPLPYPPKSMTVQATQVGVLGVIIGAAALGVFLIAYAARTVRRGRPAGGAGDPVNDGPAADQGGDHSTEPAEPDTVMAERTELGTAGAPGP